MGGFFHDVSNGLEKEVITVYILSIFTNLDPRICLNLLLKTGKVLGSFKLSYCSLLGSRLA